MSPEKDYAKEANQLHVIFHDSVLRTLERSTGELDRKKIDESTDEELKSLFEGIEKSISTAHDIFDTLVLWVETMQREIYRLQGALEESRRHHWPKPSIGGRLYGDKAPPVSASTAGV